MPIIETQPGDQATEQVERTPAKNKHEDLHIPSEDLDTEFSQRDQELLFTTAPVSVPPLAYPLQLGQSSRVPMSKGKG